MGLTCVISMDSGLLAIVMAGVLLGLTGQLRGIAVEEKCIRCAVGRGGER